MLTQTVFHREPPPWFDERIRSLKPGGRIRIGDGKLVSFNGKGWHLYDFREKTSEVYEPVMSLAERLEVVKAQREADTQAAASVALPTHGAMSHPKDWPLEARVWFYKAGISNPEIEGLGALWSAPMGRVVVPYRTMSSEAAWIARDPFWTKASTGPKYLFPSGVSRGGGARFQTLSVPVGVVVVEDVLSAFRIARDTDLGAVAAQGTSLDRGALVHIALASVMHNAPVFTWLDPDKYGQAGARRIRESLLNLGVPQVHNIVSERDPKLHEPHEIREALET